MAAEARVRAAAFQRPYGATGQPLELDALFMLGVPVGSAVLFDGIKVREVTGLALIQPGLRRSPTRSRWIAAHLSAPIPSRDARQHKQGKKPQLCSGAESRRLPKSDWNPVTSCLDMKFCRAFGNGRRRIQPRVALSQIPRHLGIAGRDGRRRSFSQARMN
jgi:hypothetical protein